MCSPKTNILVALYNILERNSSILTPIFRSNGTPNAAGDSLEYFIKDMFCTGASQYQHENEKKKVYFEYLSWTGNSKNFPDFIVRGGVGVEPKKLNDDSYSTLALNSSYPKDYIYPDSQNLPPEDKIDETAWEKKEVIYVAGNLDTKVNKDKLLTLWLAYGNTFVADRNVYLSLVEEIRQSISKSNATLEKSKELARAKEIDPLKNTNLRMRGMYELVHPHKYFGNHLSFETPDQSTRIYVVMLLCDYNSIDNKPNLQKFIDEGRLKMSHIMIPNPNDPNVDLEAILFEGYTD